MIIDRKTLINELNRVKPLTLPKWASKKVKVKGPWILDRKDINKDHFLKNVRKNDVITRRAKLLWNSFKHGVDFDQELPVVLDNGGKRYDLFSGFGRDTMMDIYSPDQTFYAYHIIECNDKKIERQLRMWFNRNIPSCNNDKASLIHNAILAVKEKDIPNKRGSIRNWLKRVEPSMDTKDITEILNTVTKRLKTPKTATNFWGYTNPTINNWVNGSWSRSSNTYNYLRGTTNHKENLYYSFMLQGHEVEQLVKAQQRYNDKGLKTIFIAGVRGQDITGKDKLKKLRLKLLKSADKFLESINDFYGKSNWKKWPEAFKIIGFVPQSKDENSGDLIQLKEI
jgi:hypothetical protein